MLRAALLALMGGVALSGAVFGVALVLSDLASARPRAFMDAWADGRSIGTHADRQRMLDRLAMAIALSPLEANHFLDLGRFYAWHASLHPAGTERHRLFSARALAAFEQAIERRPSWGDAWVHAAEQRVALGLQARRTLDMVLHASRLAPGEARTQLKVLWVGLGYWPGLSDQQRERLQQSLQTLLLQPKHALAAARIARHHDRLELLNGYDALLEKDSRYQRLRDAP